MELMVEAFGPFTIVSALTGNSFDYLHTQEFGNAYIFFCFEIRFDRFFCSFLEVVPCFLPACGILEGLELSLRGSHPRPFRPKH